MRPYSEIIKLTATSNSANYPLLCYINKTVPRTDTAIRNQRIGDCFRFFYLVETVLSSTKTENVEEWDKNELIHAVKFTESIFINRLAQIAQICNEHEILFTLQLPQQGEVDGRMFVVRPQYTNYWR